MAQVVLKKAIEPDAKTIARFVGMPLLRCCLLKFTLKQQALEQEQEQRAFHLKELTNADVSSA